MRPGTEGAGQAGSVGAKGLCKQSCEEGRGGGRRGASAGLVAVIFGVLKAEALAGGRMWGGVAGGHLGFVKVRNEGTNVPWRMDDSVYVTFSLLET